MGVAAGFTVLAIPAPIASSTLLSIALVWDRVNFSAGLTSPRLTVTGTWSVTRGEGQWATVGNESLTVSQSVMSWTPANYNTIDSSVSDWLTTVVQNAGYSTVGWAGLTTITVNG